jgi:GNAT superfamily N-acetyltransferase
MRVINSKGANLKPDLIRKISEVTSQESSLSYRSVEILKKTNLILAIDGKEKICGWIEYYKIWKNWWGLSTLFVFPRYRGQKIGKAILIPAGVKTLKDKKIFSSVTDKKIGQVLQNYGFRETKLNELSTGILLKVMLVRYGNLKSFIKLFKLSKKGLQYFVKC